jgi:hypothetical protein
MKEQLVSFKTAVLAKEKGFNIRCTHMFDRHQEIQTTPSLKHITTVDNIIKELKTPSQIFAPTQSLLQMWIWEIHKFWVQSTPIFTANECIGISVTISSWKFPVITVDYVGFDVYDGLEKGLFEALNNSI